MRGSMISTVLRRTGRVPALSSAVQAIAGGALGSSAVAAVRVASRAIGTAAVGRTIAAIAGKTVACSGVAVRDTA